MVLLTATLAFDINLTWITSPPNSNTGGSRLIFYITFSYFLSIFYLLRCTLPNFLCFFPGFLAILPFSHRTTISSKFFQHPTRFRAVNSFCELSQSLHGTAALRFNNTNKKVLQIVDSALISA